MTDATSKDFYVVLDGQQAGPFSLIELAQYAATGRVTTASLAWQQGMADWQPASTIAALAPVFSGSPVIPQPQAPFQSHPQTVVGLPAPGVGTYAEFQQRFLSGVVDVFVVFGGTVILFGASDLGGAALIVISLLYWWACISRHGNGQTLGDRVVGIRTIDESTRRPLAEGKAGLYTLVLTIAGMVGWVWILIDPKKRALHDIAAGSVVVRTK